MQSLGNAIDELAGIEPDALNDEELHALVVGLERESSRLAGERARLLAASDARRLWADDGSKGAAARLAREASCSTRSTRRELKRARKLTSMPLTAAALAEGKLSVDQADLLAWANQPELAHLFAGDEWLLVDKVRELRFFAARQAVTYWVQEARDEIGTPPSCCRRDGRYLNAVRTLGDTVDIAGSLDAIWGTEFLSELERLEQLEFEADWAEARASHGPGALAEALGRSAEQRRADALVAMARRSRAMPPDAQLPRPLITVLCGYGALSRTCELADGTVIAPADLVPLLAEADLERIVFDGPSRVIDVGVRRRFFTGATRRAVEVRDRHCQHPSGCDVPAERCHIDHIVPYSQGGLTVQDNGRCYCPVHNRQRVGEGSMGDGRGPPPDDG